MAIAKIVNPPMHGGRTSIERAIKYIANPAKTTAQAPALTPEEKAEQQELCAQMGLDPATIPAAMRQYVACGPGVSSIENAADEFMAAKRGKIGGRSAYHFIVSFDPKERQSAENPNGATPAIALECGMEIAQALFSGYQYVVAAHVEREHLHAHIIVNSVSMETGKKMRLEKTFVRNRLYTECNRVCAAHGLMPIIADSDKRRSNQRARAGSVADRHFDGLRETINLDIRTAASGTHTQDEMLARMEEMGYEIDWSPDGAVPKFRPKEGGEYFWRQDMFYTYPELEALQFIENRDPVCAESAKILAARGKHELYVRYDAYAMLTELQGVERRLDINPLEYNDKDKRRQEADLLLRYKIETLDQLKTLCVDLDNQLKTIRDDRYKIRGRLNKFDREFQALDIVKSLQTKNELADDEKKRLRDAQNIIQRSSFKTFEGLEAERQNLLARKKSLSGKRKKIKTDLDVAQRITQERIKQAERALEAFWADADIGYRMSRGEKQQTSQDLDQYVQTTLKAGLAKLADPTEIRSLLDLMGKSEMGTELENYVLLKEQMPKLKEQMPNATLIGTTAKWKSIGRTVNENAKPFYLVTTVEENGIKHGMLAKVFDISQTSGREPPKPNIAELIVALWRRYGVYMKAATGAMPHGTIDPTTRRVYVNPGTVSEIPAMLLIRLVAELYTNIRVPGRNGRDPEAAAIAHAVFAHFGGSMHAAYTRELDRWCAENTDEQVGSACLYKMLEHVLSETQAFADNVENEIERLYEQGIHVPADYPFTTSRTATRSMDMDWER